MFFLILVFLLWCEIQDFFEFSCGFCSIFLLISVTFVLVKGWFSVVYSGVFIQYLFSLSARKFMPGHVVMFYSACLALLAWYSCISAGIKIHKGHGPHFTVDQAAASRGSCMLVTHSWTWLYTPSLKTGRYMHTVTSRPVSVD